MNCRASAQPRENCSNLAARGGFFAFDGPEVDFLKAVHCRSASLSCSTRSFSSARRFSRLHAPPAFSKLFSRLWLSISRCWISLYFRESCRWWDAACTPWSTAKIQEKDRGSSLFSPLPLPPPSHSFWALLLFFVIRAEPMIIIAFASSSSYGASGYTNNRLHIRHEQRNHEGYLTS